MDIKYKITFYSYWHVGSGLSGGADVDSLVIKDKAGLPFIPGKTIKGLARNKASILAANNVKGIDKSFIDTVFGEERDENTPKTKTEIGCAYFSNASLSKNLQESITGQMQAFLYDKIASTRIDPESNTAIKHSLRTMEVTVPLYLFGSIINIPENQKNSIEKCLKMIKNLGTNRNRGLGRCEFEILQKGGEK